MFAVSSNESKKMVRYCIYARVSTELQERDGTSIESQKSIILDIIKRDPNGVIDEERHIFVDSASGLTDGRPSFQRMVEAVKRKEFDVIVVLNLDRFFRKLTLATKYLDLFDEYGVKFKSINQDFDTTTAGGKAMLQILFVFANMEAEYIAARTKLGKKTNALDGKYVGGGIAPYGYRLDNRTLLINEQEASVVKRIFNMYVKEGKNVSDMCKILTAENTPIRSAKKMKTAKTAEKNGATPPIESNLWNGSLIYKILKNTIYYGKYYYGRRSKKRIIPDPSIPLDKRRKYEYSFNPEKDWVIMCSPRIIGTSDEEGRDIYESAQRLLTENRKRRGKVGDYAFSGKIISDLEGHYTYTGNKNRHGTIIYKIHQASTKPNFPKKVGIQVLEEEIVESVMEFLKELINTPSRRMESLLRDKVRNDDKVKGYENEIKGYEKRLQEIDGQIANLMESLKEYPKLGSDIEKSIDNIVKERDTLTKEVVYKRSLVEDIEKAYVNSFKVKDMLLSFKANIDILPYETKKELAKSLVERVWIDLDRHYRFELSISEDIKKYFDDSNDSDDESGAEKPPKKPKGPKSGSGSLSSPARTDGETNSNLSPLEEGGQNNDGGVINSSSSPVRIQPQEPVTSGINKRQFL